MNDRLDGYHGTSRDAAVSILREHQFRISGSWRDWLGKGVYFFQDDSHQAYKFAQARQKLPEDRISVLHAKIDTTCGEALDLLVDKDRKFIEEYTRAIRDILRQKEMEIGKWQHKEGFVLDFLHERQPFCLVRAAYSVPRKRTAEGLAFETAHIQICVKDTACILPDSIEEVDGNADKRIQRKCLEGSEKHIDR